MNVINVNGQMKPKLVLFCRLCGEASDSYIQIFGHEGTAHSLSNKISMYLQVEVSNSDLLPKVICNKCFCKLEEFHNFFLAGKKVQSMLKSAINDSNKFSIKINIGLLKNEASKDNFCKIDEGNAKNVSLIHDKEKAESDITNVEPFSYSNKELEDEKIKILEHCNDPGNVEMLPLNFTNDYNFEYQEILDFIDGKMNDSNEKIFETTNKIDENLSKKNSLVHSNMTNNSSTHDNSNNNNNNANMLLSPESEIEKTVDFLTESEIEKNSSKSKSVLQKEIDFIDTVIRLPCLSCKEIFMKPRELIDHFKEKHCNETPVFKCRICGRLNKNLKKFFIHYQDHKNDEYICPICGKSFNRQWTLKLHSAVHTDVKHYSCDQCEKSFKTINALRNHKKIHLPDEYKPKYVCAHCGKSFKSKFLLMSHNRIHTGQKDFVCNICGKSFISKSLLLYHMTIHNYKENIKCHFCDKGFHTEKLLEQHLLVHSLDKSFKCEYCEKQYSNRSCLKQHRTLHTGELPYKCKSCPKRFRLKIALTTHERQHTGEKPYLCRTCDHAFTDFANFNKHMKRKHNKINVIERNDELILIKI